ncbi:hypothetical protein V2S66_08435 [Streptomyces sp. V4-01]|uniref:Uncharacterized protein n=1 Tax=Actinacidiphila polyblastidii TaxID=3110430 RepID=A0ABU7P854_9ACTN|nr:hypothetical protein [Streptomyces sp. V4-01]
MVAAWVMFVSGCTIAGLGVRALAAGGDRQPRTPLRGGIGRVLMGAGLAADGVPMIAGWSTAVGASVAAAGLLAVLVGAALQLRLRT